MKPVAAVAPVGKPAEVTEESPPQQPAEEPPADDRLAGRPVRIYIDKEDHSFVNGE